MAQDAEGTQKGGRSAVGPDRGLSNASNAAYAGNGRAGKSDRDVPLHDKSGEKSAAGNDARNASTVMSQEHSAKSGVTSGAEDTKGQQSGRKRRRSRPRRKKGGQPPQAGNGTHASNPGSGPDTNPDSKSADRKPNDAVRASADGKTPSDARGAGQEAGRSADQGSQKKRSRRKSRNRDGNRPNQTAQEPASQSRDSGQRDNQQRDAKRSETKQGEARKGADQSGRGKGHSSNGAPANAHRHRNDQPRHGRPHGHPSQARDTSRQAYAALDLGTNNCRLLVAEPHGQSFRVVDAFSRIVRLGEGLSQTGRLSEDAQDRAISALKVCQSKLNYRAVKRFRLIATEACRRATNGGAFLHRVYRETGLKLEIVNRETEARLAVSGCASLVHPEADGVVLFDIGGGSSEIVWLDLDPVTDEGLPLPGEKRNRQTRRALRHMSERIRCWTSLQVGVVTLSEKHGGHVVDREQFEAMVSEVRDMLHDFEEREALTEAIKTKHIHMLGTSGTVTTLAGVHLGLERYDRRLVDGAWLNATELRAMIARILDMDFEERTNNPCIGQDRADLVLAGCAILEAFHREWPCTQLRVADRGLREGILMEMMIDDGVWNPRQPTKPGEPSKKPGSKKRRSRRRGGRGQRGAQGTGQAAGAVGKPDQNA